MDSLSFPIRFWIIRYPVINPSVEKSSNRSNHYYLFFFKKKKHFSIQFRIISPHLWMKIHRHHEEKYGNKKNAHPTRISEGGGVSPLFVTSNIFTPPWVNAWHRVKHHASPLIFTQEIFLIFRVERGFTIPHFSSNRVVNYRKNSNEN